MIHDEYDVMYITTQYMGCKQTCLTAAIDGIYCLGKVFFFFRNDDVK